METGAGSVGGEGYRPDIDGLRAVAVASVVAFHAVPGWLPGGFVGVDLFFVISGYLITGIILRRLEQGRFSFLAFYARRIRRIFPALILVLALSWGAAWLILTGRDFQEFGFQMAGSAAFAGNFTFWGEGGYFGDYAYLKPLLHLWSLGIEEQFYLAWPLLLWLVFRRPALLPYAIGALAAASFSLSLYLTATDPAAAFYSPLGRAWELLAGAMTAILPRWASSSSRLIDNLGAWLGLVLVGLPLFLLLDRESFPGLWALLPVGGGVLLIRSGPEAWVNARLLALRPMVWVGLISYPLYLWHWPLLSFAALYNFDGHLAGPLRVAIAAFAVLPAWATYRFLERPIRIRRSVGVPWLCAAMLLVFAAGVAAWAGGGFPGRKADLDPRRQFVAGYRHFYAERLASLYRAECDFNDWDVGPVKSQIPAACTAPGRRGTWFLWGDSHAQALSPGLRSAVPPGVALAQVTSGGCRASLEPDTGEDAALLGARGRACRRSNAYALRRIAELKPEVVILARRRGHETRDWEALARGLLRLGAKQVVVAGPVPQWTEPLPHIVARHYWPRIPMLVGRSLNPAVLRTDDAMRRRYAESAVLSYVSLTGPLCAADGCRALAAPGELMALDYGHLSQAGSLLVGTRILGPAVEDILRPRSSPSEPAER